MGDVTNRPCKRHASVFQLYLIPFNGSDLYSVKPLQFSSQLESKAQIRMNLRFWMTIGLSGVREEMSTVILGWGKDSGVTLRSSKLPASFLICALLLECCCCCGCSDSDSLPLALASLSEEAAEPRLPFAIVV